MDEKMLERIIEGLVQAEGGPWTDTELAEELGEPLPAVQRIINRLVGKGRLVQLGQASRRVLPAGHP